MEDQSSKKKASNEVKKKKEVKFNNKIDIKIYNKRKWNDFKSTENKMSGKFSDREIEILQREVCNFAKENHMGLDELAKLCSLS